MDLSRYSISQREAIESRGNVCVLSSAGSGKTTLLIGRTIHLIKESKIKEENILLITFSRKAADNMESRLKTIIGDNKVNIGTFHSICYGILRAEDKFFSNCSIIKDYHKKKIICDIVVRSLRLLNSDSDVDVPNILRFISIQKANMKYYTCDDRELVFVDEQPFSMDTMRDIYREYELEKRQQGLIDFDDMQYYCIRLLMAKPKILEKYRKLYRYTLVDECQDTSISQIDFLKMLNEENQEMFWVGDPKQSIFSFRGSSPSFIMNFDKMFKNSRIIYMDINYRCSKSIVDLSNRLLSNSEESRHKYYKDAIANSTYEREPEYNVYIDSMEEAEAIGNKIKDMIRCDEELKWNDFAIIMRTNAQTCSLERIFSEMEIPYVIYGSSRSFFELREIQDMLAFLRLGLNKDDNAFERIYCVPPRWLGKAFLIEVKGIAVNNNTNCFDSIKNLDNKTAFKYRGGISSIESIQHNISKMIGRCNVGDILRMIRDITKYDSYISKEIGIEDGGDTKCEKVENLDMLCEQGNGYVDVEKFLSDIDKIISKKEEKQKDRKDYSKINSVQITTSHKSKGLEFKNVFGIGINFGLFPHSKSKDVGEERRLLYVLCTRAEKGLYLSSTLYHNKRNVIPSEFLYDIFDRDMIDEKVKYKRDIMKMGSKSEEKNKEKNKENNKENNKK